MVAASKIYTAVLATAVLATPIAQGGSDSVVVQKRGDAPLVGVEVDAENALKGGALNARGDSDKTFLALTTLLAQVGDFVGDALNDVLHLDLSNVGDDVSKLLKNLLDFLDKLTGAATAYKPTGDSAAVKIQNQMASSSLQNVLTGVAKLVNDLLSKLLDSDLIQTVAADLRDLVKDLDKLVTGLADNLIGYSSITSLLGGILSAVNSALEVAPVSTKA